MDDPRAILNPDQDVKVKIISVDAYERKIGLSIKSAMRDVELAEVQGYAGGNTGGATLGDVMADKLGAVLGGKSKED